MGWLEGALRIMPPWETHIWGITIGWNIFVPGVLLMGLLFTVLGVYPFVEAWITGDRREHHLLDRPRNQPTRTGLGVAGMTAYGLLWAAGGNDVIATHFHLSIEMITWFMRIAIFVGPVIAFIIARRWAISLQRHDRELVLHGYETGVIVRSPQGGYEEIHAPVGAGRAYTLTSHERHAPVELPGGEDANGVAAPRAGLGRMRARLSQFWFGDAVDKPTAGELAHTDHHDQHLPGAMPGHHGIESGGMVGGDDFEIEEHAPTASPD
jgi:ubiquinol-cytochrome c reductase cytochrome b subunit